MDYTDLSSHRLMVRDHARTSAFQAALAKTVTKDSVVLDLGAGCGILSLLAAQAAAARVYAVERCPQAAQMAQHLAQANGFAEVIQVINGDIRQVQLPEQVTVIVSEWMGTIGVDENMLGAVLWARDHFLADGGVMIPAKVAAMVAPVSPAQRVERGFFAAQPYGLDLTALTEPDMSELLMVRRKITPGDLAAPAKEAWVSDAARDTPDSVRTPYEAALSFAIKKAAKVSALAVWFKADLGGKVTLANAPDAPDTHWGQMLCPLDGELSLSSGDTLNVELKGWSVGPGPLMFAWRWQVNDGPWRGLNTAGESTDPPPSATRSQLSAFLADLSLDPVKYAAFLGDPEKIMTDAKLSKEHIAAISSHDPMAIGRALFESEES